MPLNSSGPISLGGATSGQSVNLELNQAATTQISLGSLAVTNLSGAATAGTQISLSTLYRKSDISFTLGMSNNGAGAYNCQIFLSRFSTGTYTISGAAYPNAAAIYGGIGAVQTSTEGLWIGGDIAGNNTKSSEIAGMTFATQTLYNPATASSAITYWTGMSYLDLAGYLGGGYDSAGSYYSAIFKYVHSTTAFTSIAAGLTAQKILACGFFSATTGYHLGAALGPTASAATKLVFNTETTAGMGASNANYGHSGMQSKTLGYFYGIGETQKITFATDTIAAWSAPSMGTVGQSGSQGTSNNVKSHNVYNNGGGIFTFATETWAAATLSLSYGTFTQTLGISPNIHVII